MTHENDVVKINYEEQALSRIIQQYKNLPNFEAVIKLYASISEDLESELFELFFLSDIDLMAGHNLDVIGDIVGQSRVLVDADQLSFFGFEGDASAKSFGDLNEATVGGRFRDEDESVTGNVVVADPEYRILIRARIIKNYTKCTPEEILSQLNFLFKTQKSYIKEHDMVMDLGVGKKLDEIELFFITEYDLLPRASGVRIGDIIEFDGDTGGFSFQGGGGLGFGDTADSEIGGIMANLLIGGKKPSGFSSAFNISFR